MCTESPGELEKCEAENVADLGFAAQQLLNDALIDDTLRDGYVSLQPCIG